MMKPLLAPAITQLGGHSPNDLAEHTVQDSGKAPILLQYWNIALRWKYLVFGIIALALVAGLVITLMMTPQYTARSQIEISRDQKNPTNVEGLEAANSAQDQEFYQTQYTLLESRSLAERVARQLNLGNSEEFYAAHSLEFDPGRRNAQDRVREAAGLLLGHINISPVSRSRLVDISYTSNSPDLSKRIANAWVQNFIQSSMDRRFASTTDARGFLESRLTELATRLEDAERKAVAFAAEKGIVALSASRDSNGRSDVQKTLASSELEALSNELAKATSDRVAAEAATVGRMNAGIVENQTIGTLRAKRAEIAADYSRMLEQFEPGYPAVASLHRQIKSLDLAISAEEGRINQSRSTTFAEAVKREGTLRSKVQEAAGRLGQQTRDEIQYNIYRRDADTTRQLYDSLLQRYKEIGVAGVSANNIAIVDPAEAPTSPSSPRIFTNMFIALVLGIGLALAVVAGLEQIDEGLREPADVRRLLQLPLLGAIPSQSDDVLAELADSKSELSEAYLSVRSNLAFTTAHGLPRSLVVTSSRPGEGKSTTAFALATVLARTGKRTLLIDADMRSPSIHGFLGAGNAKGLSNFLAGDDNWPALVEPVSNGSLQIMTAGPMPPSAAELLSGDRMGLLVHALSETYDNIVIDGPPLLGLADAPLLSGATEGCVFVVESGGVAVRGLRAALNRLHMAHAHVFGVVLTKLPLNQSSYGYGYGYGFRYGEKDEREPAS